MAMSRNERLAWMALIVVALVLHLSALGARPPHHDESIHCQFAYTLMTQGTYRYDPTYHGPLLYYVLVGFFALFGATTTVSRLYPALAGVALVALPIVLRRRLGRATAWWCGVLLAISPIMLYYSRFTRNDVPVALFTAVALTLFLLVREKGWRPIPWIGAAAAAHAISKETFYVLLPLLGAASYVTALRDGVWESVRKAFAWIDRYRVAVGTAILWFVIVTLTAYTVFLTHPEDFLFPVKAIQYWYHQHEIQRVGGPKTYHLTRLALYEFLPIAAAFIWVGRRALSRWRNGVPTYGHPNRSPWGSLLPLSRLELFCFAWGVGGLAMYAFLGEKVPWLEVHQVLPFIPLAGAQLARTFSRRGRWWSRSLAAAGIVATVWSAAASSFLYPAMTTSDPHGELIVFVQTTPEEEALADEGRALAAVHKGDTPVAAVEGEGAWPLSWQWKKVPVWWAMPEKGMHPELVVCDPGQEGAVRERVGEDYSVHRIPFRAWWVENVPGVTASAVLRWFFTRKTWSPIGSTDVMVLESKEK
jgi:uncharacterized protein (TIGR03663 family)